MLSSQNKFLAIALIAICFLTSFVVYADGYPIDWHQYTTSEYLFDIESEQVSSSVSKSKAIEVARNNALTNLARQIEVKVEDEAISVRKQTNYKVKETYRAKTKFSTDVNLEIVNHKTYFDSRSRTAYAIAYINRPNACKYYSTKLDAMLSKATSLKESSDKYVKSGQKDKAISKLEDALSALSDGDAALAWLNVLTTNKNITTSYIRSLNDKMLGINSTLARLKEGAKVYVKCNATLSGKNYSTLANEVKGIFSKKGLSIASDPTEADYVITINAVDRRGPKPSDAYGYYFTYVDAEISVDDNVTGRTVYQNEVSCKGGHTSNYNEAGKDAYSQLAALIKKELKDIVTK